MERQRSATRGSEVFVETLNDLGVENIFLNPGIDLVPVLGTIATYRARERKVPRVVLCTDESVAVAAAHGYAMATGKPQIVMVFQDVGLLQGGGAIVNLKYGRVPVILCSGANSTPGRRDWRGEPADQKKITRDYVKWDHEITAHEDISSVLREAFRVASAEPAGPVYLSIGNGVLMDKPGKAQVEARLPVDQPSSLDLRAADLQRASEILISAKNPLIMAAYSGRHRESVAMLVDMAEILGARAITTDLRMNFPSTHPLCPGIDAIKGGAYDHYIEESDALLLVDYNFPGPVPKQAAPKAGARIVHVDVEPLKNGAFLWNRKPDVLFEGNSARILPPLVKAIKGALTADKKQRIEERSMRIRKENESVKENFRKKALDDAGKKPISTDWLSHCINEAIDNDTVIVHMIPSNADSLARQIRRTKPGTMFCWGESAGSMGWSLGAALGAKLAEPNRMVVSLIGDGGFIFGCPVATLWSAVAYHAPFLSVIFNNHSYAAFKELLPMFCEEDFTDSDLGFEVGLHIKNPPDFAAIARACSAFGETVEGPSDLPAALERAIRAVRDGSPAVLDVKIEV